MCKKCNSKPPQELWAIGGGDELVRGIKDFAHNIPLELVFIMDETFVWYILVGSMNIYNTKNAKQVQVH